MVQYLVDYGAAVDLIYRVDITPLCWAAYSGHLETVGCLLDQGAGDKNRRMSDSAKMYPFSWAADKGHWEIVDLLLARVDHICIASELCKQAVLLCVAACVMWQSPH